MKAEKIKYIDNNTEYVLLRSNQYIGSTQLNNEEQYVYNFETKAFEYKSIEFVPALLKLFSEILANSVDEAIKTNYKFSNKIEVKFKQNGTIIIIDNGRGISSEIEEITKLPSAVVAVTELKSGSNFDDTINSESIGQNGVGSVCVNIFSKKFICDTSDGIKRTIINCKNNLSSSSFKQKKSKKQFTIIEFLPDYERLNIDLRANWTLYNTLIYQQLLSMSLCHPNIKFSYNESIIKETTLKKYVEMFDADNKITFHEKNKYFELMIIPFQDRKETISFVNGAYTYKNGQHVTSFEKRLEKAFTLYSSNKSSLKQVDIKHLLTNCKCFMVLKNFKKPRFSSQIKNELINSLSDISEFWIDFDFQHLIKQIVTNKNHMGLVKDFSQFNEKMKERKNVEKDEKKLKKRKIAKYLPPISNKLEYCNLYICEGDSAIGQLINVRDNFTAGYPLRGKIMNPRKKTVKKVLENEIIRDLLTICELKLSSDDISKFPFKSIRILTDQDLDGFAIGLQLLNLFFTYWPELFKRGKVLLIHSPLIEAKKKGSKTVEKFYTMEEFNKVRKNYVITKYNKGLGSLSRATYKDMIMNPKMDKFMYNDETEEYLEMIFGKTGQDRRKEWIKE